MNRDILLQKTPDCKFLNGLKFEQKFTSNEKSPNPAVFLIFRISLSKFLKSWENSAECRTKASNGESHKPYTVLYKLYNFK